ncbi:MAG: thrombospondin type 3 repeat-containing protein, partial [Cyanobacteria bacterium P01_B01_bin.77]
MHRELCSTLIEFDGLYYFCGDAGSSKSLWVTDGTSQGTEKIADGEPSSMTVLGDHLYYLRDGRRLTKTDGSAGGTSHVSATFFRNLYGVLNDKLLLSAWDSTHGEELWVSDGTEHGTQLLLDINPGRSSGVGSFVSNETPLIKDNRAFFIADDGTTGIELWVTTGVTNETIQLIDANPGSGASFIRNIDDALGGVVFSANNELYITDGTPAGTSPITNFAASGTTLSTFDSYFALDNSLYFFSAAPPGSSTDRLWVTDGSLVNTQQLSSIDVPSSEIESPQFHTRIGNNVYFVARTRTVGPPTSTVSEELWVTDGSSAGTKRITNRDSIFHSDITPLGEANGELLFLAESFDEGVALWMTNTSQGEYSLVKDFDPLVFEFGSSGSESMYMGARDGVHYFVLDIETDQARSFWKTDGTASGTVLVGNFINTSTIGNNPSLFISHFSVLPDSVVFSASDPVIGGLFRMWQDDDFGAWVLAELSPSASIDTTDAQFSEPVRLNSVEYFLARGDSGSHTFSLWRTNGTTAGTSRVKRLCGGNDICTISRSEIIATNTHLFILIDGEYLWVSDGTEVGTQMIKTVGSYFPVTQRAQKLTNMNNEVYFYGYDSSHGLELWKSAGTPETTELVKDIYPGVVSSAFTSSGQELLQSSNFAVHNQELYFSANDGVNGAELWKSNGSNVGTELVSNIRPAAGLGSKPYDISSANGTIYFAAYTDDFGYELWSSDGTAANTLMIKDIAPGNGGDSLPLNSSPVGFFPFKNKVIFRAFTEQEGYEMWVTDGTTAGTMQISDIYVGSRSAFNVRQVTDSPSYRFELKDLEFHRDIVAIADLLYFITDDHLFSSGSTELWKTDGTPDGESRVLKIDNSGFRSKDIKDLTFAPNQDGYLFFSAPNQDEVETLWLTNGTETGSRIATAENEPLLEDPSRLRSFNGALLFDATGNVKGNELWKFTPTIAPGEQCLTSSESILTNFDNDALSDLCDPDDDNDGVPDLMDSNSLNQFICADADNDMCDDCSSGTVNASLDGPDNDSDGLCDLGDLNDDTDSIPDSTDNCPFIANEDQADLDQDMIGDLCDPDADGDQVDNTQDSNDFNNNVCLDSDADMCDDCTSGSFNPLADGFDNDSDGLCDIGDPNDDTDSILDSVDNCPFIANEDQADLDQDMVGDLCDPDVDGDQVDNTQDSNDFNNNVCLDSDADMCDDCTSGSFNPLADGLDNDSDGLCDIGDPDADGDQVDNTQDSNDFNNNVCLDSDADMCDDCTS